MLATAPVVDDDMGKLANRYRCFSRTAFWHNGYFGGHYVAPEACLGAAGTRKNQLHALSLEGFYAGYELLLHRGYQCLVRSAVNLSYGEFIRAVKLVRLKAINAQHAGG
jgi:hypothetical protein